MKQNEEQAKWYVIHTYSGHEKKVQATIQKTVQNRNLEDLIQDVSVPVEEIVVEDKNGKKRTRERKIFPGYCLVKMVVTDESWYIVRNTKGVTGFVGPNSKPIPLTDAEVYNMGLEKPESKPVVYNIDYEVGDKVMVKSGPLKGFMGVVEEIHLDKGIARVLVFMFSDRETSTDINVSQIEKA